MIERSPPPYHCSSFRPRTPAQICVLPPVSGEDRQYGFRHGSYVGAQRLPGAVRQLSEHQRWSVGDTAEHPPGSAGEQHGPQRGTMLDRETVSLLLRWK